MDEQVVPSFAPPGVVPGAPSSLRRTSTVRANLVALVPSCPDRVKRVVDASIPFPPSTTSKPTLPVSPAAEFPGKPRWETPLRVGKWPEPWQSARELGLDVCVRSAASAGVGAVIRSAVADTVVAYVGPQLPRNTVEKWLCLLCEYLELNADEQVLVVCLLRKYVRCGGRFVGQGDWARPQRWECVVAVACYLAVLLTEEFPGRTAMDLRELLGPNFRFGSEQVSFLKVVNWRISIDSDDFKEVKETCQLVAKGDTAARQTISSWFHVNKAVNDRKRHAAEVTAVSTVSTVAAAAASMSPTTVVGKKRGYAAIALAEDSVVPRVVIPRIEARHVHAVPTIATVPTVPTAFLQAVPQWTAHW